MTLTLREVLDHELIRAARPRLISGAASVDRSVRWIHSADLYDIAPLLRGGEVLLTNGVGLVGMEAPKRRAYVRSLAARGVSALLFEIGRTFQQLPADMASEAVALGLPLIVLDPVLRFTEVAEALNSLVINESVDRLRRADEISRRLSETLANGGGLDDIVHQISEFTGARVDLYNELEEVVASAGSALPQLGAGHRRNASILVQSTMWGRLSLDAERSEAALIDAVLERAPTVIALALMRHQPSVAASLHMRHALIDQLVEGLQVTPGALADRLHATGMPIENHEYVCVVLTTQANQAAMSLLTDISRHFGHGMAAVIDNAACAVIAAKTSTSQPTLGTRIQQMMATELAKQGQGRAGVGRTIQCIEDLPRSMSQTRLALTMADEAYDSRRVIFGRDFAVECLLRRYNDQAELRAFVDEHLGPLIKHDSQHDSKLIETLEALVRSQTRAAAAEVLNIRRQSLYYRLRKIEALTQIDLDDPRQCGIVLVALAGSRTLRRGTR